MYLSQEKENIFEEKLEFEQYKNSVLCTKCKLSLENPIQGLYAIILHN